MIRKRLSAPLTIAATSLVAFFATTDAEAQQCGTVSPISRCTVGTHRGLNVAGFARDVANGMARLVPPTKGFSIAFFGANDDWTPVLTLSRGLASGPVDPTLSWTPQTASALASVSKVLTESAVRHAIEVNNATSTRAACRVTPQTKFLGLLTSAFRRAADAGRDELGRSHYDNATLNQVLTHSAGIPNNATLLPDGTYDYYEMMERPEGHRACVRGTPCYSNDNYVVATTILPLLLDCSLRATVESEAKTSCASKPAGYKRDLCEIQYAFTKLGIMSNNIVQSMILDVLSTKTSCWPQNLVNNNIPVALGYVDANAARGAYVQPTAVDVRGCGVGGWHMPAEDLGRVLKRFWHGSFFNFKSTADAITVDQNGALPIGYSSWAYNIIDTVNGEHLSMALLANSPTNAFDIKQFVDAAFVANQIAPGAAPVNAITSSRGTWKCIQDEATWNDKLTMRISTPTDIKLFNGLDFDGQGSEENWTSGSYATNTASGDYLFYRATSGPRGLNVFPGKWTLRRDGATLRITRVDTATGWTGNYVCNKIADGLP